MRKNYMLGASVFALGLGFLSLAHAQTSDVVVDLSVLDSLSPSSVSDVAAQPLFPVVKKSEEKTVVKKAPVRKKAKPARKTVKAVPAAKVVPAVKVEVRAEEPVVAVPAPVVPEVVDIKENAPVETLAPVKNEVVAEVESKSNEIRPVTEDEHIVVVDVEPVSPKREVVEQPPVAEVVAPVVPKTVDEPEKVSNSLLFEPDVSDLTPAQQQQIDAIISSFDNPQQNKIAILAYNLDDGVDTFKRKRLSLNRAVDVRSYLLQKGYKNFSIKVINIASGSDRVNSVEIMEMK